MNLKYDYWDPKLELTNHDETYKLLEYILYRNDITFHDKTILDVGCGWGTNSIQVACGVSKSGYWQVPKNVTGIDYDSAEIDSAKKSTKHLSNLDFRYHDILTPFPFENNSVDIVFSTYTLHNLTDIQKLFVFQEVARVLRVKGHFIYIDVLFDEESERSAISSRDSLEKMWLKEAISLPENEMDTLLEVHLDPMHPFSLLLTGVNEFPILVSQAKYIGVQAGLKLIDSTSVRGLVCCKRMIFEK